MIDPQFMCSTSCPRRILLGLVLVLASACSRSAANPTPLPAPVLAVVASAEQPSASPLSSVQPPQPVSNLPGDEQLPEPWRTRFRAWLSAQSNRSYVRVIDSQVISNAVSVVLERRTEKAGVCLTGPSRVELIQDEEAKPASAEVQDFGDDCCPGSECVPTSEAWNLRYLALLTAKNWPELSKLVPAQRQLVWTINGGEQPTVKLTRKDVAAGRLHDGPNCGFMYNVPSCDGIVAGSSRFSCRCDGGGYHVRYAWEREGVGFVLVGIDEDSH